MLNNPADMAGLGSKQTQIRSIILVEMICRQ